jgi:hypothetical protein
MNFKARFVSLLDWLGWYGITLVIICYVGMVMCWPVVGWALSY